MEIDEELVRKLIKIGVVSTLVSIPLDLGLKFIVVAPLAVALSFFVGFVIKQLPVARDIV